EALAAAQKANDALAATEILKTAFRTDVSPILAEARLCAGGALDPVAAFRASGYRAAVAEARPVSAGAGGGIV
ncbi:MAG: sugar isomerase, partial [Pseudomonadota bacterium]